MYSQNDAPAIGPSFLVQAGRHDTRLFSSSPGSFLTLRRSLLSVCIISGCFVSRLLLLHLLMLKDILWTFCSKSIRRTFSLYIVNRSGKTYIVGQWFKGWEHRSRIRFSKKDVLFNSFLWRVKGLRVKHDMRECKLLPLQFFSMIMLNGRLPICVKVQVHSAGQKNYNDKMKSKCPIKTLR